MKFQQILIVALALVLVTIPFVAADAAADSVSAIPGWPTPIPFQVYAGYLDIPNTDRSLYYILVGSQNSFENDPVVLWLNGGPACSSLMGFLSEIGPFVFDDGQTQSTGELNAHSWNKRANILFIESPAGVGFSVANISNTAYDDDKTRVEQNSALTVFFARFTNLKNNDFYIAGESYAGIYIPNLAAAIHTNNVAVTPSDPSYINLKGIMVGNGVANRSSLQLAPFEFYYSQGLIPQQIYEYHSQFCLGAQNTSTGCTFIQNYVADNLLGVNPYGIYKECMPNPSKNSRSKLLYSPWYTQIFGTTIIPCALSAGGYNFLNTLEVKQALHVRNVSKYWDSCNDDIYHKYTKIGNGSVYQYEFLKGKGYKVLVYSGDTDAVVPTLDTMNWVYNLNWAELHSYRPWFSNGQVAGFTVEFDGLNFTTVLGAGHMVPQWNREEAFLLFDSFINGTALPSQPLSS